MNDFHGNMPGRARQNTFRKMEEKLDEYNKLSESQLKRPIPKIPYNNSSSVKVFEWPNWTLWFAILVPVMIVFYSAVVLHTT